ncbi:MAG: universal stress protein [Gemmatimonadetes bacterium]|nr:universal stress protein [Gemmatimonadota bacterium]
MKIETVVAGVDFAGAGLASARWIARHFGPDRVVLVHSLHLPKPPRFLAPLWGDEEQILVSARAGAKLRLTEFAEQLERETGVSTEARNRLGEPAEQLAAVADSTDADLIVVGPHANDRGRWSLLGGTATQLLHEARVPTLIGRGALRGPPERILAPIDENAVDAGVLDWISGLSGHLEIEPTLFHVLEDPIEAHLRAVEPPRRPPDVELEALARDWLSDSVREAGLPEGTGLGVVTGEPAVEILAAAQRYRADLIVMGTHGFGTLRRTLMGSVADTVIRRAPCPVLALPTHSPAKRESSERTQVA